MIITIFRRVQQVFSAYLVINNYLLKCFKIKHTELLITTAIPQFRVISCLNNQYFNFLFIMPYVWQMGGWVDGWMFE